MPLPELDTSKVYDQLFSDIMDYIAQAEAMVEARDALSLQGLDSAVEALCQRIIELDPAQGKPYADKLAEMVERLDQLQQKMKTFKGEVANDIRSLNKHKAANKTYKKNQPEE